MKVKKLLACALALSMLAVPLSACDSGGAGGASSGGSSGASGSVGEEAPREISLCMSQIRWGAGSVDEKMMQEWTKVIEENTNTKIEIISPTHNDYEEKLNVLLSAGDYPDVIRVQQAWDLVPQYATRGYLQPVTQYLENDARFASANKDFAEFYRSGDELYGIPGGGISTKIIWFRADMVEKYGMNIKETMTTDEFVAELKKVNQQETIPFSFPKHIINFQIFYNFFGAYGGILPDENGVYYDGIQTEEMREALLWVKSLYDEGLMDPEFITNENSAMREKLSSGKAVADVDYTSRYSYYTQASKDVGAETDFIPVYTLSGPNGDMGDLNESGNEAYVLSATNQNVEASLDVIHWLVFTPKGKMHNTFGVEGVHYDLVDNVLVPKEEAVSAGYAIEYGELAGGIISMDDLDFTFQDIETDVLSKMIEVMNTSASEEYLGSIYKIPMGMSPLYDQNIASYNAYLYEMATKVVLGSQTIDEAYADYEKFWNSIQGDEMLAELNA